MSVFAIEPVSATASRFVASLILDPEQPYLDDHRPGGDPLFGTVMAIEALSSLALHAAPGMRVQVIESLENHAPFVLHAGDAPVLEGMLEREPACEPARGRAAFRGVLTSAGNGNSRCLHIRATLRLGATFDLPPRAQRFAAACEPLPVSSQDIYTVFFHGPALRVVGAACWQGGRLYARSAQGLPPCFAASGSTVAAPRLIELALQTAGLFEIAANQRMMIPHSIRRIERFSDLEIDCGRTFWAVAARSTGATPQDLDVDVVDADGLLHVRVNAYRTLPLPFGVDPAGPATLQRCFF